MNLLRSLSIVLSIFFLGFCAFSQEGVDNSKLEPKTEKAEAIIKKAVTKLGGPRYLNVTTTVGEGKFSVLKEGRIASFQSFIDVIVFPNKERTDFEERGSKTVQVNIGESGWIYEEHLESFGDQSESQIEGFEQSLRSHYDHLLRGAWKGKAQLSYAGRRSASLGKRNDVVKLDFEGGFWVEYEFDDEGLPMKTVFTRFGEDDLLITEETRYAQYVTTGGILTPFIVDRYSNDQHSFRVNYQALEYNRQIPNEIFVKPNDTKKLRKKLKL